MALTGRTALVALLGAALAPFGSGWLIGLGAALLLGVAADLLPAGRIADAPRATPLGGGPAWR